MAHNQNTAIINQRINTALRGSLDNEFGREVIEDEQQCGR